MGMIGGGRGAFIGSVHRMAAAMDGQIELVCGAFSSSSEKSKASAKDLNISADRAYGSFEEMIHSEKQLPHHQRMDFVSIVTPNDMHYAPAKLALENGFHVICDKPLCYDMEEAYDLQNIVNQTGLIFALTHNYTGYPMVKQSRQMVRDGALGTIRKVIVEYQQGWLSTKIEDTDQKQAAWRTDPSRSGIAGAVGDIGTHAENLAEYITGLRISSLCADVTAFVDGRRLDDDANILLRFEGGAKGVLITSQIAVGEENNLNIRVYGTTAGIEWRQMNPNTLLYKPLEGAQQVMRTAVQPIYPKAQNATRLPSGHPEGFLEAFANIYRGFAHCLQARLDGNAPDPAMMDFPDINDGVRGMQFIYKAIASGNSDQKWNDF